MATYSSILACRVPWTEKPVRLQSKGSQRVNHNWITEPTTLDCSACSWTNLWSLCNYCPKNIPILPPLPACVSESHLPTHTVLSMCCHFLVPGSTPLSEEALFSFLVSGNSLTPQIKHRASSTGGVSQDCDLNPLLNSWESWGSVVGRDLAWVTQPLSTALSAGPLKLRNTVTLQTRLLAPGVPLTPKSESATVNTGGHGLGEIILSLLISPGGCLCKYLTLLVPSEVKNNMLYPSEISFLSSLVDNIFQPSLCLLHVIPSYIAPPEAASSEGGLGIKRTRDSGALFLLGIAFDC